MSRDTIRALAGALGGSFLILGLAYLFLVSEPLVGRAEAGERVCGEASWYGTESGSRTYTGEHFDGTSFTAAMPSTKHIGERWRVTYRGKSVVVRINDYGPAARLHRIMDLSRAAAASIGLIHAGVGRVCVERL